MWVSTNIRNQFTIILSRFYWDQESKIKLNDQPVDFWKRDMGYLLKENYDPIFQNLISEAMTIQTIDELVTVPVQNSAKIFYSFRCA